MTGSARAVRDWLGSGATDARIADQVGAVLAFEARLANVSRYVAVSVLGAGLGAFCFCYRAVIGIVKTQAAHA